MRIEKFVEVDVPGGTRSETLVAGLEAVDTEYFAVLDEDDFWLSDHIEGLFAAAQLADPDFDVSFSGTIRVAPDGNQSRGELAWTRTIHTFGFGKPPAKIADLTGAFSSNCFVARTALIPPAIRSLALMESAEDSALVALVARHKRPVFSYRATAFFRRGFDGESSFVTSAARQRDLLSLELRAGMLLSPSWFSTASDEELTAAELARRFVDDGTALVRIIFALAVGDDRHLRRQQLVSALRKRWRARQR